MPSLVSTGQITIIDSNDAKPITAFVTASISPQQINNPDTGTAFTPDYTVSPYLVLTARVYVGSTIESAASLSNKKWATSVGGPALSTTTTLTINTNQTPGAAATTYFFEADYVDPLTGGMTHIVAQIQTSIVRTGSNATYIQITGKDVIEQATGVTKNVGYIVATLYRGSQEDVDVTRYKWYQFIDGAYQQIYTGNTALTQLVGGVNYTVAQLYGFKLQSDYLITPLTPPVIGANPAALTDDTILRRGISISELAVQDIGLFKVKIEDGLDPFETTFTVYDVSDPYDTQIISTAGDKLTNGTGSTDLFPRMWYGGGRIADLTGWSFVWNFQDKNGLPAAFINETKTGNNAGMPITTNTASPTNTVTLNLTLANSNLVANAVIKLVNGALVKYYDIASVANVTGTAPVITVKTSATSGIAQYTPLVATEFAGGRLFICDYTMTTPGGALETAAKINVTEWEIDTKGTIYCAATRP